jgi:hypothetical protein
LHEGFFAQAKSAAMRKIPRATLAPAFAGIEVPAGSMPGPEDHRESLAGTKLVKTVDRRLTTGGQGRV